MNAEENWNFKARQPRVTREVITSLLQAVREINARKTNFERYSCFCWNKKKHEAHTRFTKKSAQHEQRVKY